VGLKNIYISLGRNQFLAHGGLQEAESEQNDFIAPFSGDFGAIMASLKYAVKVL